MTDWQAICDIWHEITVRHSCYARPSQADCVIRPYGTKVMCNCLIPEVTGCLPVCQWLPWPGSILGSQRRQHVMAACDGTMEMKQAWCKQYVLTEITVTCYCKKAWQTWAGGRCQFTSCKEQLPQDSLRQQYFCESHIAVQSYNMNSLHQNHQLPLQDALSWHITVCSFIWATQPTDALFHCSVILASVGLAL